MCDLTSCATSWNSERRRSRGSETFSTEPNTISCSAVSQRSSAAWSNASRDGEMPVETALGHAKPTRKRLYCNRRHALLGDLVQRLAGPVIGAQAPGA
jgi:hypothetical protein